MTKCRMVTLNMVIWLLRSLGSDGVPLLLISHDFTMQIFVKTLTGRTLTCEVEPTTKVGPALSIPISNLSGATGISIAKIKGSSSTSVLVKAAAQELARFWKGDSLPVRQYLETNVIKPPLSPGRSWSDFFLNVFTMVNLHQMGNPEAVVCWCLLPHPKITANQAQVSRAGRRSLHLPGPYWFTCFIGWVADRSQPIFHFKGCEQRHGSAKACAWRSKDAWQTQEASQDSGWRSRSTTLAQQGRGSDCRVCLREVSFIPRKSFAFYRNS